MTSVFLFLSLFYLGYWELGAFFRGHIGRNLKDFFFLNSHEMINVARPIKPLTQIMKYRSYRCACSGNLSL